MIEDLNTWLPLYGAWIVVCTVLSFVIARQKGIKPLLPAAAGFLAAFIPIVGVIYLVVLGTRPAK